MNLYKFAFSLCLYGVASFGEGWSKTTIRDFLFYQIEGSETTKQFRTKLLIFSHVFRALMTLPVSVALANLRNNRMAMLIASGLMLLCYWLTFLNPDQAYFFRFFAPYSLFLVSHSAFEVSHHSLVLDQTSDGIERNFFVASKSFFDILGILSANVYFKLGIKLWNLEGRKLQNINLTATCLSTGVCSAITFFGTREAKAKNHSLKNSLLQISFFFNFNPFRHFVLLFVLTHIALKIFSLLLQTNLVLIFKFKSLEISLFFAVMYSVMCVFSWFYSAKLVFFSRKLVFSVAIFFFVVPLICVGVAPKQQWSGNKAFHFSFMVLSGMGISGMKFVPLTAIPTVIEKMQSSTQEKSATICYGLVFFLSSLATSFTRAVVLLGFYNSSEHKYKDAKRIVFCFLPVTMGIAIVLLIRVIDLLKITQVQGQDRS